MKILIIELFRHGWTITQSYGYDVLYGTYCDFKIIHLQSWDFLNQAVDATLRCLN